MDEHGRWHLSGKGAHRRDFPAQLGLSPEDVEAHGWPPDQEWRLGNKLYRSQTMSRKDAITPGGSWAAVWSVMSALAGLHGAANAPARRLIRQVTSGRGATPPARSLNRATEAGAVRRQVARRELDWCISAAVAVCLRTARERVTRAAFRLRVHRPGPVLLVRA
jgi:transposase-like protein